MIFYKPANCLRPQNRRSSNGVHAANSINSNDYEKNLNFIIHYFIRPYSKDFLKFGNSIEVLQITRHRSGSVSRKITK